MAKCPKCNRRKGKRPCPVLGEPICESCCGRLRGTEIQCTLDCPFFRRAEADKKLRQIERSKRLDEARQAVADSDARVERLQLELERIVCSRNRSFNDVTDHEIMLAAQDALNKVQAEPEGKDTEPDEPDLEALFVTTLREGPKCLKGVTPEERQLAVASLIQSVRPYAEEGGGSRHYVEFLMNTVDEGYAVWRTSEATRNALRLLQSGRPSAAIDILKRECDAHPTDAVLHVITAQACEECDRHEDAFEAAQKAAEINPRNVHFLITLVQAAAHTGRVCAAWNVAGKALALDPGPGDRSWLRDIQGKLMKTIQGQLAGRPHLDMKKLAQFERATYAGLSAARQGQIDQAEAQFREAVEIDPQCADTQAMLGQVYLQQQRVDEAKQAFAAALQIDPKHDAAKRGLAEVGRAAKGSAEPDGPGVIITP